MIVQRKEFLMRSDVIGIGLLYFFVYYTKNIERSLTSFTSILGRRTPVDGVYVNVLIDYNFIQSSPRTTVITNSISNQC